MKWNARGQEFLHGLRTFHLFNVDLVPNRNEKHPDLFGREPVQVPALDHFVASTGARVKRDGDVATYFPGDELIRVPATEASFDTTHSTRRQNYYSTLLHELVHWTDHVSRENRNGPFDNGGRAILSRSWSPNSVPRSSVRNSSSKTSPRKNRGQYLTSRLRFLEERPANLWRADAFAQCAATFLLGFRNEEPEADGSNPSWLQGQPVQIDLLAPILRILANVNTDSGAT